MKTLKKVSIFNNYIIIFDFKINSIFIYLKDDFDKAYILVSLYGFAFFNTEKLLSQALFPLKNLNFSEQNYATLHMENINAASSEILKKDTCNNLMELVETENFEKSYKAIDFSNDYRIIPSNTEKPHLLIGLKYIKNDDQIGDSLFVTIYEGKHFFDRNKPNKLPSTIKVLTL